MVQSILMQKCIAFPTELPVETKEFGNKDNELLFKTELRYLGLSEYTKSEILKYQVIHPVGDNFVGTGHAEDGTSYDLIAVSTEETFNIFKTDDNFLYITGSRKAILEHGIKRLIGGTYSFQEEQRFKSKGVKLNLTSLKEELEADVLAQVKGGWWRDLQIADVEVAYLGGGTVTESQNWTNYEDSEGIISALRLDFPNVMDNGEEILKILLTKEGNLVVYKDIADEKELLEVAVSIFDLASKHIIEE